MLSTIFFENLPDSYEEWQSRMNRKNVTNYLQKLLKDCKNENRHFLKSVKTLLGLYSKMNIADLKACLFGVCALFAKGCVEHTIQDYLLEDVYLMIPMLCIQINTEWTVDRMEKT